MSEPRRRLDQPKAPRGLRAPRISQEAVGSAAENIARFFGTARYLLLQTVLVVVWIVVSLSSTWLATTWPINPFAAISGGTEKGSINRPLP